MRNAFNIIVCFFDDLESSSASYSLQSEYLFLLKISSEMNVKGEGDYTELYDYLGNAYFQALFPFICFYKKK